MTAADVRPEPRSPQVSRVVAALLVLLAAVLLLAPSADAAKKKRVIAISPFAAQTMVQLGYPPIRKGATLGETPFQAKLLSKVPPMKLSHPNGPNMEEVLKLRPDLVFSSNQWAKGNATMRKLGIKVVVADPLSPNAVAAKVNLIGRNLGRQKQARKLNKKIAAKVRAATRNIRGTRDRVLVVLGVGTTAMAFLQNSWGGRLVTKAGGSLVTGGASSKGGFARISDEVVLEQDPDRIIVVPHGNADDIERVRDYILDNEVWKATKAYQDGHIYISGDNTLLQAGTDIGPTINRIRSQYLQNR